MAHYLATLFNWQSLAEVLDLTVGFFPVGDYTSHRNPGTLKAVVPHRASIDWSSVGSLMLSQACCPLPPFECLNDFDPSHGNADYAEHEVSTTSRVGRRNNLNN